MSKGIVLPSVLLCIGITALVTTSIWLLSHDTISLLNHNTLDIQNSDKEMDAFIQSMDLPSANNRGFNCSGDNKSEFCQISFTNTAINFSRYFSDLERCVAKTTDINVAVFPRANVTCLSFEGLTDFETQYNLLLRSSVIIEAPSLLKVHGAVKIENDLIVNNDLTIIAGSSIEINKLSVAPNVHAYFVTPRAISIQQFVVDGYLYTLERRGEKHVGIAKGEIMSFERKNKLRWGIYW